MKPLVAISTVALLAAIVSVSGTATADITQYEVYVRYFAFENRDLWESKFGLISGGLAVYDGFNTSHTVIATNPARADQMLWESFLSSTTTTAGGVPRVYFDDNGTPEGHVNGIRLVKIPEPATIVLLALGFGLLGLVRFCPLLQEFALKTVRARKALLHGSEFEHRLGRLR